MESTFRRSVLIAAVILYSLALGPGSVYPATSAAATYVDGDVFVAVSLFQPSTLFSNNGDGTFTDVTDAAGIGLSGRYYAPV